MLDLLNNDEVEVLQLPGAELLLWRKPDLGWPPQTLMQRFVDETEWSQAQVRIFGKSHLQPRLSAWHGDFSYYYSGIRHQPQPWTQTLLNLKARIESITGLPFNSVLLNFYRYGNDGIGMHSDDERELGEQPAIASLSLGETRDLVLRHRSRKDLKTVKLPLPPGTLLLMRGDTQKNWRHGINKTRRVCGPRINLTFRKVMPAP